MSTTAPKDSLLGQISEPLGLRIRGTDRDGQVVWLTAPKVTIGSDPRSTLRLRAPGITPTHCLILRGSQHTIARRWSLDSRYNGRSFDEAPLAAGDRLGIGPLEFEVVTKHLQRAGWKADRAEPCIEFAAPAPLADAVSLSPNAPPTAAEIPADLQKLAELTRTARRLTARLKAGKRQARRRIRKLTAEIRSARLRAEELERQLNQRADEAARREHRQAEWDSQKQALDEERKQWLQTQLHIEQLLAELDRRQEAEHSTAAEPAPRDTVPLPLAAIEHEKLQNQLDQLRATHEAERQAWQSQRATWEAELVERQAALQQETEQHKQWQATLDQQRADLDGQVKSLAAQQQQLDNQQAELAELSRTIDAQRQACQAEQEQLRQTQTQSAASIAAAQSLDHERQLIAQQQAELAAAQAKLQQQQQQLDDERQQVVASQQQLAAERQSLAAAQAALQSEQQSLAAEQARCTSDTQSLAAAEQELQASRQSLLQQQARLEQLENELTHSRRELAQAQQALVDIQAELQLQASQWQLAQQTPASTEDSSRAAEPIVAEERVEPGDDNSDIFARLRALSILKDGDAAPLNNADDAATMNTRALVNESIVNESVGSQFADNAPTSDEQPTVATTRIVDESPSCQPQGDEEESIDDYMARLMNRVRGGMAASSAAPKKAPQQVSAPVVTTNTATTSRLIEPAVMNFSEFEPRTAAPEKTRDLAAMREIANFTARTAIAKHIWKRRIVLLVKRFIVGVVALLCGIALMTIAPPSHPHYFYCGMVAVVASLIWFLPSIYRAKRYNVKARSAQDVANTDYGNLPSRYEHGDAPAEAPSAK